MEIEIIYYMNLLEMRKNFLEECLGKEDLSVKAIREFNNTLKEIKTEIKYYKKHYKK